MHQHQEFISVLLGVWVVNSMLITTYLTIKILDMVLGKG
jgi:hypothetical protein